MKAQGRRGSPGLFPLIVSILLGMGGVYVAYGEASPYLRVGSVIDRAAQVTTHMDLGLSISSMTAVLTDCIGAIRRLKSLEMAYTPPENRTRMLENCLAVSDTISERAPSLSLAWLTGAYATSALKDFDGFNQRLQQSWLAAPNEQWLVEMRVELAEAYLKNLSESSLAVHTEDLRLLVRSAVGLGDIARRWIEDESFRERIFQIVEDMPEETQRKFISNLQQAIGNAH